MITLIRVVMKFVQFKKRILRIPITHTHNFMLIYAGWKSAKLNQKQCENAQHDY